FEDEDIEGIEFEGGGVAGGEVGHAGRFVGIGGFEIVSGGGVIRELEGGGGVDLDLGGVVGGIAECEDAFFGRPRGPAVNFAFEGAAANPMRVNQSVCVGAGPFGGLGEVVPVLRREKARGDVHFLELCATTEVVAHFVAEGSGGVVGEAVGVAGIDDAVEHEGVQRIEFAAANDFLMDIIVPVGDPALALRFGAGDKGMILAAAPDGIGVKKPKGGGPGAGGLVNVEVGLDVAQFGDKAQHGFEIATAGGGVEAVVDTNTVEFELVDAIFLNGLQAKGAEPLIVFGAGHGEVAVADFEALLGAILEALFVRLAIAAPRRKPNARIGAVLLGGGANGGKAIGEAGVEMPKGLVVVPAVIEQKGIHFDAAFLDQLVAENADDVESVFFVEFIEVTEVVPGVVMEERAIGMGPLAFEVGKKTAAELAFVEKADDGGASETLARLKGGAARHRTADVLAVGAIDRERMLCAKEHVVSDDGAAIDGSGGAGVGNPHIEQDNFGEWKDALAAGE